MPVSSHAVIASSGSFLITPSVGLMIWTLLVFGISMLLLRRFAFPAIRDALDRRQKAIEDSIDTAERTRVEADTAARRVPRAAARRRARRPRRSSRGRARPPRSTSTRRSRRRASAASSMLEQTRSATSRLETRRAIDEIRNEVTTLTILATEKVTRKTLDSDDQRRLVEEALGELDFSALGARRTSAMEEIATVYARALFEAAQEQGRLDVVREQLGQFADALDANRDLQVFFFSPYFSTQEKRDGLARDADRRRPAADQLPRAADREPPHAGDLPHAPRARRALGAGEPPAARSRSPARSRSTTPTVARDRRADRRADRPDDRAHHRPSTPTSSAASCCASATRSSTHRSATVLNNYASKSPGPSRPPPRRKEPNRTCRSTPTRSPASSRAASRGSTPAARR